MPEDTKKAPPVNDALRLYRASRARQGERRNAELAKAVASLTADPAKEPAKRGRPPNPPPPPPPETPKAPDCPPAGGGNCAPGSDPKETVQ